MRFVGSVGDQYAAHVEPFAGRWNPTCRMFRGSWTSRKRVPCSYHPTATRSFDSSNQCDEQLMENDAFESEPFSSVIHVSRGRSPPTFIETAQVSNLPWPRQPPGGTSSVST